MGGTSFAISFVRKRWPDQRKKKSHKQNARTKKRVCFHDHTKHKNHKDKPRANETNAGADEEKRNTATRRVTTRSLWFDCVVTRRADEKEIVGSTQENGADKACDHPCCCDCQQTIFYFSFVSLKDDFWKGSNSSMPSGAMCV